MKKIFIIIILLILVFPVYGSSGDGISFNINNFKLKITWPWQDKIPSLYGRSGFELILIIKDNYEALAKRNEKIWIDYYLDEKENKIIISFEKTKNEEWIRYYKEIIPLDDNFYERLFKLIRDQLDLNKPKINDCEVYIVFIPNEYINDDSLYEGKVLYFLFKSELYLAHEAALQSNYQGYVYSIFFNKKVMYNFLNELDIKHIIINKKRLTEEYIYYFDIVLY
jgi:hypothetical protein